MKNVKHLSTDISLRARAEQLKLYGLLAHWDDINNTDWLGKIIHWEEAERLQRGFEQRMKHSRIGRFKPLADFDWSWPKECDRSLIESCMQLDFIKDATNIFLCGPNGVGKTMIARNLGYEAIRKGYTVLFIKASQMLNDLASQDGDNALRRRFKYYAHPQVLLCDEIGYLSYSNRHADLLFEIVSRRYQEKSMIITTNKAFSEWDEVFPNAACVVSLIDRLVHHSEIITIEGDSFRLKEAQEKRQQRKKNREKNSKKKA